MSEYLNGQQIHDLLSSGIDHADHNRSLEEYPAVMKWLDSSEGKDFLSGKKDLILQGNGPSVDIGILFQRWFILVKGHNSGFVTDLEELVLLLSENNKELLDDRLNSRNIFIKGFFLDESRWLSAQERYRVIRYVEHRRKSNNFDHTILHFDKSDRNIREWYPGYFVDFLYNNFFWDNSLPYFMGED